MDHFTQGKFTFCGGCVAKLPQGLLQKAVADIPVKADNDLLVGFDTSDDAAIYRISDDRAVIATLDFFPPMIDDPYLFGQIAATNALSDVYAMGGKVLTALNIVCFPEDGDLSVLSAILRGGGEKVLESGGVLAGGHSISDSQIKYGLSVTGAVHPERVWRNNTCETGDKIILTKPLGVGMVMAAYALGEASQESRDQAVLSMCTLNKYAFEIAEKFNVHSCTDVTGFGLLGHLNEMVTKNYSIAVDSASVPYIPESLRLAREFLITAAGQKNRDFLEDKVVFENVAEPLQEILFDPQTSGGLLLSVAPGDAEDLLAELGLLELESAIIAEVQDRRDCNIIVR